MITIRTATSSDLGQIVGIYNQAILAGQMTGDLVPIKTEERRVWFDEHDPEKYPIFVAEKDQSVAGYLTISAYRPGRMALRHTAEVSYYIHSGYHRQGIASALLKHAVLICPVLQIKTLIAVILEANPASIGLPGKYNFAGGGYLPGAAEFDGRETGHLYYGLKI